MIFMLGYMSSNVVSHRCHSQVLPYVKLLLQSLRRAELWFILPDTHCVGSQEYVTFFSFSMDFYGNMADVRAWFQGISGRARSSSKQFSLRAWPISLVVRTLPPEFHYKDQAGHGGATTQVQQPRHGSTRLTPVDGWPRCIALCRIDTTIWNVASMLAVFSTGTAEFCRVCGWGTTVLTEDALDRNPSWL